MSLLTCIVDVSVISGGWEIRLVFDVNDFDLYILKIAEKSFRLFVCFQDKMTILSVPKF